MPLACFISYAREDIDRALPLVEALTARGHECWCDIRDLVPGAKWQDDVQDAILRSDIVVFLLSPASLTSEGCADELRIASEFAKKVLPVQVLPVEEKSGSNLYSHIADLHWIVPGDSATQAELVDRVVAAAGSDFERSRWVREVLLLARRGEGKAGNAVLLTGAPLRQAEQAITSETALAPDRLRQALAYLETCRNDERSRLRRRTAIGLAVLVALTVLALTAVAQWLRALEREADNRAAFLASEATATLREPWRFTSWAANSRRAALLLVNAMQGDANQRYLEGAVELGRLIRPVEQAQLPASASAATATPDGSTLVFGTFDGDLFVQRAGEAAARVASLGKAIWAVAIEHTGSMAGAVDEQGGVHIVELSAQPVRVKRLAVQRGWRIAMSRRRLAVAHDPRGVSVGPTGGEQWTRSDTPGRVTTMAMNPYTNDLVVATDSGALLTWSPRASRPRRDLRVEGSLDHIYMAPGGNVTFLGGAQGLFRIESGRATRLALPIQHGVTALAGDASRSLIAVAAWDGALHVWDWANGREMARLPSPDRDIEALFFDKAHRLHAVSGASHWHWDLSPRVPRLQVTCETSARGVQASAGHVWIDCGARSVRHVDTHEDVWRTAAATLLRDTNWVAASGSTALAGGPLGVFSLTAGGDTVSVRDVSEVVSIRSHVSARGDLIAGVAADGRHVVVWNARTGRVQHAETAGKEVAAVAVAAPSNVMTFCDVEGTCQWLALDSDVRAQRESALRVRALSLDDAGRRAAITTSDAEVWIWTPSTGGWVGLRDVPQPMFASGFLLGGSRYFVSSADVHVFDTTSGEKVGVLQHRGEVQDGAAAMANGQVLLTVGFEQVGRLWDASVLVEVAKFPAAGVYPHGAYAIAADRFALWSAQERVELWDLSTKWLRRSLCEGTTGTLDDQAWQRVGLNRRSAEDCSRE